VIPLLAIGTQPLELERLVAAAAHDGSDASASSGQDPSTRSGQDGAVVAFLGLVRNHNLGRSVRYLEYEAYEPLALKVFERMPARAPKRSGSRARDGAIVRPAARHHRRVGTGARARARRNDRRRLARTGARVP